MHGSTDGRAQSNMTLQLFKSWGLKSWGHKNVQMQVHL